ncbi:MAG: DUF1343 domain-containing protein [Balneolaceae bacterium]|nr:MAG: DUF1343 domain-containing protein [Balneolaceae bacterium]
MNGLRTGLLCNHTAWDTGSGKYLFELIPDLKRIFVPEHGLFAELQDQEPLVNTAIYRDFGIDAEIVSLYGNDEKSLRVRTEHLDDLEILIIDLQDIGTRYFTFAVTMSYLLEAVQMYQPYLNVIVIDRENPAGLQVEGSPLPGEYESFIGRTGLPHRHGLTIAELALFFHKQLNAGFSLTVVPLRGEKVRRELPGHVTILKQKDSPGISHPDSWLIAPSPNIPGPVTPLIYSGQCLLEGTNISEGRGTTRPFEIFGAPWLKPVTRLKKHRGFMECRGAKLRSLRFVPTFHKWAGQVCGGFQLHLTGQPYHSLLHSLFIIRTIREYFPEFEWREGPYEKGSDKTAIELICGDPSLIDYLNGRGGIKEVKEYLIYSEIKWLAEMKSFKLYDRKNYSILQQTFIL